MATAQTIEDVIFPHESVRASNCNIQLGAVIEAAESVAGDEMLNYLCINVTKHVESDQLREETLSVLRAAKNFRSAAERLKRFMPSPESNPVCAAV